MVGLWQWLSQPILFTFVMLHLITTARKRSISLEIAGISFSLDSEALFVGVADRTYGSLLEFNRRNQFHSWTLSSDDRKAFQGSRQGFGHQKTLTPLSNLDGSHFLTGSLDKTAKLRDARTLTLLKTYATERPVNAGAISPSLIIYAPIHFNLVIFCFGAFDCHANLLPAQIRQIQAQFQLQQLRQRGPLGPNAFPMKRFGGGGGGGGGGGATKLYRGVRQRHWGKWVAEIASRGTGRGCGSARSTPRRSRARLRRRRVPAPRRRSAAQLPELRRGGAHLGPPLHPAVDAKLRAICETLAAPKAKKKGDAAADDASGPAKGSEEESSSSTDGDDASTGSSSSSSSSSLVVPEMKDLDFTEAPWDESANFVLTKYPSLEIDWDAILS
uniref:AP2/ERF domain-containing protein n=1 Tax=Ananas comosus var. bracteatus TaxID=296719 RepID=A0A6V7QX64_ANACO